MVSCHTVTSRSHRNCHNGDKILLVVKEKDSTCSLLKPPLLFISKEHSMSCSHTQHFRTICQCFHRTHAKRTFACTLQRKRKRRKERQLESFLSYTQRQKKKCNKVFCATRKRKKCKTTKNLKDCHFKLDNCVILNFDQILKLHISFTN